MHESVLRTPAGVTAPAAPAAAARLRPVGRFIGHFFEMVVAMIIGMAVIAIPVDAFARGQGYVNVYEQLPEIGAVVMTAIMVGPMAFWMAIRGHDRQMIGEMSLGMVAPLVGLIVASRLGLIAAATIPMLSDPLMYVAMLAVMLVRWRMYAGLAHDHGASA